MMNCFFQLLERHPQWKLEMVWSEHLACFTIRLKCIVRTHVLEYDIHLSRLALALDSSGDDLVEHQLAKAERLFAIEVNHYKEKL